MEALHVREHVSVVFLTLGIQLNTPYSTESMDMSY